MTDATKIINDALDYFAKSETDPGGFWAFPDDGSSLGLDFRAKDDTVFWLDIDRDGTIQLVWRPSGGDLVSLAFVHQKQEHMSTTSIP